MTHPLVTSLRHIALRKTTITLRRHCPWYIDKLQYEKQRRRRAERTWPQTRLEVHRLAYRTQREVFNRLLINTMKTYYAAKIANYTNDQNNYLASRNLTGNNDTTTMSSYVCPVDTAQRFGDHVSEKVLNIRKDIVWCGEDRSYSTMAAMSNDAVFGGMSQNRTSND